ncbi:MAG: tetratricopeptide repeat protein [Sphingobacteriales bacterium]|nr:tetratricopeptide repeat protein [Sphingobacteriales bacterium]
MNPHNRQDKSEFRALLQKYMKLKQGKAFSFIEEDEFEQIVEYFLNQDNQEDALGAAEIAVDQFPYSSTLTLMKADVLLTLRRYEAALVTVEKAELLNPNEISIYIIKTDALLATDQQELAAEVLECALNLFEGQDKIELLFEFSDVYDDYEKFDKVFDCLKMIIELDCENEEALYKICFWSDFTGRNEESIIIHQELIEKNPYSELGWFNLAAAYQGLKLYEKAIDAYQYVVAINEKFDFAYRNMGDAYMRLKKYKEAIECLEKVLMLSMPESVIFEAIGHCYDRLNNHAQARFYYKKACHFDHDDAHLHYKIACTYMNQGLFKNAIKSLQNALNQHLMQPDYNLALGKCYFEMRDYDEAITYFGNVVRVRPKQITGWIELLNCLYQAELFEEGIEYAMVAFENTDTKPIFLYYKAAFYFANAQSKEALIQLENALKLKPILIKKFIEINPSILRNQSVVDLIARYKSSKNRKP